MSRFAPERKRKRKDGEVVADRRFGTVVTRKSRREYRKHARWAMALYVSEILIQRAR